MRPVLRTDARDLNMLITKETEPDSQASVLPPLLEPQQKMLLDAVGPKVGLRRVLPNEEVQIHLAEDAKELLEDLKDDKHSFACKNF